VAPARVFNKVMVNIDRMKTNLQKSGVSSVESRQRPTPYQANGRAPHLHQANDRSPNPQQSGDDDDDADDSLSRARRYERSSVSSLL
jgi:hypothetical protein